MKSARKALRARVSSSAVTPTRRTLSSWAPIRLSSACTATPWFAMPKATSTPGPRRSVSANIPACSAARSEEHTSELQSRLHLVCRLLLEKKKEYNTNRTILGDSSRFNSYDITKFDGLYGNTPFNDYLCT